MRLPCLTPRTASALAQQLRTTEHVLYQEHDAALTCLFGTAPSQRSVSCSGQQQTGE
ncbi:MULTISPECIES: hypothetical protein [Streptomyces]|uniref:hypothetical protein n=1 Tax=Streptomyces TaxID=1883 RepID=UPI001B3C5E46|nr:MULTISPECIES: hypothetical protein [Streptomyces]MCG0284098.1 hypothetical protein [Streptomyces sp. PSAA01]